MLNAKTHSSKIRPFSLYQLHTAHDFSINATAKNRTLKHPQMTNVNTHLIRVICSLPEQRPSTDIRTIHLAQKCIHFSPQNESISLTIDTRGILIELFPWA